MDDTLIEQLKVASTAIYVAVDDHTAAEISNLFKEASKALQTTPINIIFDGPPGPERGGFVEVEDDDGHSINVGEWIERKKGMWALRITNLPAKEK